MAYDVTRWGGLVCAGDVVRDGVVLGSFVESFTDTERDECPSECECYGCHNHRLVGIPAGKIRARLSQPDWKNYRVAERAELLGLTDEALLALQRRYIEECSAGDCGMCE